MNREDFNEGLLGFLDVSPTPFHATKNMAGMFKNAGFKELREDEKWVLEAGEKYYVTRNDSSVIAFTYPKKEKKYIMVGVHTDSPNLKLKPNPVIKEHGIVKFGVESYGGLVLSSWFDRDLSIAGRVSYLNKNGSLQNSLIDVKKKIATLPSLAIHLDKDANKKRDINRQSELSPVITTDHNFDLNSFLKKQLEKEGIKEIEKIYAFELSLYDTQKASFVGVYDDFISSSRLDNLLSCYVGMVAICTVDAKKDAMLFVANDHEEVGSNTTSGAGGTFLQDTLRRISYDYEAYINMVRSSIMISIDNAHAIHPNYAQKHDEKHAPKLNNGVVVKINANQSYATNSATMARFLKRADEVNESVQLFVVRSDLRSGSTIGPITATRIGVESIDIGVATLGMHSVREVAGSKDAYSLYKILKGFSL